MKINSNGDLIKLINMCPDKFHTIMLKQKDMFVCSLVYSDIDGWMFIFGPYQKWVDREKVLNYLKLYGEEFDTYLFKSYNEMIYEMRSYIYNSTLHDMLDNENIHVILNDCRNDLGKASWFMNDKSGILLGVTARLDDYFYYYLTPELKLGFQSCVGKYELIKNPQHVLRQMLTFNEYTKTYVMKPELNKTVMNLRYEFFHNTFYEIELIHV